MKKKRKNKTITGIYGIRVETDKGPFFYVGKSSDVDRRIKQHIYNSQTDPKTHIDAAIGKYPWTWEVIKKCRDYELNKYEQKYIAKYDTYKRGYNNTIGGDNSYVSSVRKVGLKEV
jgi:excinuclease UvrABC nuclease subunit